MLRIGTYESKLYVGCERESLIYILNIFALIVKDIENKDIKEEIFSLL